MNYKEHNCLFQICKHIQTDENGKRYCDAWDDTNFHKPCPHFKLTEPVNENETDTTQWIYRGNVLRNETNPDQYKYTCIQGFEAKNHSKIEKCDIIDTIIKNVRLNPDISATEFAGLIINKISLL